MTTTLEQVVKGAPPEQILRVAKLLRSKYKESIANGEMPLEPARLRKINADIEELQKRVDREVL